MTHGNPELVPQIVGRLGPPDCRQAVSRRCFRPQPDRPSDRPVRSTPELPNHLMQLSQAEASAEVGDVVSRQQRSPKPSGRGQGTRALRVKAIREMRQSGRPGSQGDHIYRGGLSKKRVNRRKDQDDRIRGRLGGFSFVAISRLACALSRNSILNLQISNPIAAADVFRVAWEPSSDVLYCFIHTLTNRQPVPS